MERNWITALHGWAVRSRRTVSDLMGEVESGVIEQIRANEKLLENQHPVLELPKKMEQIKTALVVDDANEIRQMLREILKSFGCGMIEANNGRDAVSIYNEKNDVIDLVVLNMNLPDMTGKDVYNEIKSMNNDVEIIFYTENGWKDLKKQFSNLWREN